MSSLFRRHGHSLLELVVVIAVISLLGALSLSAVQRVRVASVRTQCQNNLRQLGLGLHGYHDARHALPPGWTSENGPERQDGYSYLGWTARILPHIEQQNLWQRIEQAYSVSPSGSVWAEPHPAITATAVPLFACPADGRVRTAQPLSAGHPVSFTSYLGVSDHRPNRYTGVLFQDSAVRLTDITDGASQTLMIGERPPAADHRFGWWYRGWGQRQEGSAEMILSVRETNRMSDYPTCPAGPYQFTPGKFDNQCDMFHFWSPHPGGAKFAFADGSVRFLRYEADSIIPALATRAGGEIVEIP